MLLVPSTQNSKLVLVSNQYIQDVNDDGWIKIRPKVVLKHRLKVNKEQTTNQTLCLEHLSDELPELPLVPYQTCCLLSPDGTPHLYTPNSIEITEINSETIDPYDTDPFHDGSLYAFYTFNETLSDTMGHFDLFMSNPQWDSGKFNRSLKLRRQSWSNSPITSSRLPQFSQGLTISFWIYPYGSYNSRRQGIVQFTESTYEDDDSGAGNTRRPYIWLHTDGRKLGVSVDLENGTTENFTTNFRLDKTKWSHVVLVVYPHSFELFVNGNIVFNRSFIEKIALSSCYLCVGTICTRHVKNYRIDQLLIFNRPLSSHEVKYLYKQGTTVSKSYTHYNISSLNLSEPPVKCDIIETREILDESTNVSTDNNVLVVEHDLSRQQAIRYGDTLCLQVGSSFHKVSVTDSNLTKEASSGKLTLRVNAQMNLDNLIHAYIIRPLIVMGLGQPDLETSKYSMYDTTLQVVSSTTSSVTIDKSNLTEMQRKTLLNQELLDFDVAADVQVINASEVSDYIVILTENLPAAPEQAQLRCRNYTQLTINHVEYLSDTDMLNIIFDDLIVGDINNIDQACRDFQFRLEVFPLGHFVLKGLFFDLMLPE